MLRSPERIILEPKPVTGPLLTTSLALDCSYPGYLRYLMTASALKRQTNFIALTILRERGPDYLTSYFRTAGLIDDFSGSDASAQVAHVLIAARAQDICKSEALFGADSCASLSVLHRIGNGPLSTSAYYSLIELMRNPEHQERARSFGRDCPVSETSIDAALRLPLPLVRQEIISRVNSAERIDELIVAFNLIFPLLPDAAMPEVWQSLESLPPEKSLKRWLDRAVEKIPRFPICGPVSDDAETTFVASPKAMREIGLRLQNCLGTKANESLLQRSVFYFWHDPEAVVELQCLSKGFFLIRGIYMKGRGAVDADAMRRIRAKFERAGKVLVGAESAQATEINRCSKLLDVWNRELPDLHDDEIIDLMEIEDAA